jgi:hypothetical protein
LLVGTDMYPQLGFLFLKQEEEQVAIDILQGRSWQVQAKEPSPPLATEAEALSETGLKPEDPITVHLLQATRIPP